MSYKKSLLSLCVGSLLLPMSAFAGAEDWQGVYLVKMQSGSVERVVHTKDYVQFMFMRSGVCSHFSKGASINGNKFKEDVDLCTAFDIKKFTQEVEKIGSITQHKIEVGPSYPSNLKISG